MDALCNSYCDNTTLDSKYFSCDSVQLNSGPVSEYPLCISEQDCVDLDTNQLVLRSANNYFQLRLFTFTLDESLRQVQAHFTKGIEEVFLNLRSEALTSMYDPSPP